jgi:uncharacterized protein (DUF488 family)
MTRRLPAWSKNKTPTNVDANLKLFTIGFANKKAEELFEKLRATDVKRVLDVRLNNVSQLAGFSKREDLKYFLRTILDIDYVHLPELAPTKRMLDAYKKHKGDWKVYEMEFVELIKGRRIEHTLAKDAIDHGCLLCSEDQPHHCHRRLVAEYLQRHWQRVSIQHLI